MNKRQGAKCIISIKTLVLILGITGLSACGGGRAGNSQATDPTVAERPIAYVKRPTPTTNNIPVSGDVSDPEAMQPGAHLIVKMTAAVNSPEIDITKAIIGSTGDVRDPTFSSDGTKLLFALHKQAVNNANPPITWDIYEYDLTKPLSQTPGSENPWLVMPFNSTDGNDIEPHFMPGDRILFSSDRATETTGAIELNEGFFGIFKPTVEDPKSNKHSFHLFSMALDGTDLHQLTFNMSDDLYPSVIRYMPGLAGRVMFSRWEHSPGKNQMSLYTMKPDGSDVQMLYGEYSHNTGSNNSTIQFTHPRETSDGKVLALAMPFTGTFDGGDPVLIDVSNYSDINVPVNSGSGVTGPGQISLSNHVVSTVPGISKGGRYSSIFPLLDGTNRALVSYSLCYVIVTDTTTNTTQTKSCNDPTVNLSDPNTTEAPPRYGIFIYDIGTNTILPITVPEAGIYYTDIVAAQRLSDAPYIPYSTASGPTGILDIHSVYDMDGSFNPMGSVATTLAQLADPAQSTADKVDNPNLIERPAVFLRIVKGVYMPDQNTFNFKSSAFGVSNAQLMRQIIGYIPIDPDGSVRAEVPANVPLSISVLDKNGRRIGNQHGIWLTVRPGETVSCVGCHNPNSTTPHGRFAAQPNSFYKGATTAEVAAGKFNNTLIAPTEVGQTMAEARTSAGGIVTLKPSVDIIFNDVWTDMSTANNIAARSNVDAPFFYEYSWMPAWTSAGKVAPVDSTCMVPTGSWAPRCRTVINYEANIDPMWSYSPRYVTDAIGNQILDSNNQPIDVTCVTCHSFSNPDPNNPGVPAGQLDLSDNALSQTNADWLGSYSQLLLDHDEVDATGQPVLDANGNPITITSSMNHGSAASSSFFKEFTSTHCTVSNGVCQPWLTVHELKLLSEWVDIGAQYYNNPFVAPVN